MVSFKWSTRPWSSKTPPSMGDATNDFTVVEDEIVNNLDFADGVLNRFNVVDYGADPTGVTECAAEMQLAIDAAELAAATTGAQSFVEIPANGDFKVASGLVVDSSNVFVGAVGGRGRIKPTDTASFTEPILHFNGAAGAPLTECGVFNLKIDGNKGNVTTPEAGIKVEDCAFFRMDGVEVQSVDKIGIYTDSSATDGTTENVRNFYSRISVRSCDGVGIKFQSEKNSQFTNINSDNNGDSGIVFEGLSGTQTSNLNETTQCIVSDIKSSDNDGEGMVLDGTARYVISNVSINANGKAGILLRNSNSGGGSPEPNSGPISFGMNNIDLRNNCTTSGHHIETSADNTFVNGATINGLRIQADSASIDDADGIDIRGWQNVTISGFHITSVQSTAIRLSVGEQTDGTANQAQKINLVGGTVVGNGSATATDSNGIAIEDSSEDITISNVYLQNSQTSGANYEIRVAGTASNVNVTGCYLEAVTNNREIIVGTSAHGKVWIDPSCVFRNLTNSVSVTSAAELDPLWQSNGVIMTVGGTTPITSIQTRPNGWRLSMRFNNGSLWPTLTDGNNILLENGNDWTPDSNADIIHLLSDGTNWYEISRRNIS